MIRYIALLRGINISGKNKIPMAELKKGFEDLCFCDVRTYLNSGNVMFSGSEDDITGITEKIEEMIRETFSLDIPVFVIKTEKLKDIIRHAPEWWGTDDKSIYDNLIFIMPPTTFAEVHEAIGEPKEGLERSWNMTMRYSGPLILRITGRPTGGLKLLLCRLDQG